MTARFGPRRAQWIDLGSRCAPLARDEERAFETLDAAYRALCAMLYNYAPLSGHPGGSISSGRIVQQLLFGAMDYDVARPDRDDADVLSYAAGHKALGLYSLLALQNEIVRLTNAALLPRVEDQLRFEDLLGFRRNPTNDTPLFRRLGAKALDGHPTPATPSVRLSTGASGVGMGSSLGLALAAFDWFGDAAPRVHVVEGEGGLTPGRVAEVLAFAGTASLRNVVVHVDWNQASIDSDRVTREGNVRGDYVQWEPAELFYLHDWNVIVVPDGSSFAQVRAAQRRALDLDNDQPTAIVYRTTKGWKYGLEGSASHGAGHKLCSSAFLRALPLPKDEVALLPSCDIAAQRCRGGAEKETIEHCYWDALSLLRRWLERQHEDVALLGERVVAARQRLDLDARTPRPNVPSIDDVYVLSRASSPPPEVDLKIGGDSTLRAQLGKTLGYLNRFSGGALFIAAADLLGSTSIAEAGKEFAGGYFDTVDNRDSRTLSVGGICEDGMSAVLSGIATFGRHIAAGSSYGAFIAPLGHIAARLHAIGDGARRERLGGASRPMILICGHAGLKTGEDGPTHADPQPLQLLQENFPPGAMITLTPWEPQEIWHLMSAALEARPAVIAPFVTRPAEKVLDREALGLAPAHEARRGVYLLRRARGPRDGTVVLQESGVAYAFVTDALPRLEADGIDVDVFYVASAELYDPSHGEFTEAQAQEAMGITGFTLPTMYRWIRSDFGRAMTLHPFMHGTYPGSGPGAVVIAQAGLDGESQYTRIKEYVRARKVSPRA
jgi:transketolase